MEAYLRKLQMIEILRTLGLLSNEQGTELLNNLHQNLYNSNIQISQGAQPFQNTAQGSVLSDFFNSQPRKDLKKFFNDNFKQGEKFDEKTFANLIENIEKDAISGYQRNKDFEQNLARSNDSAKGKLTAQVQTSGSAGAKCDKIFTRKEIGKMSLEEFQKNEDEIMSQYEQGLIQ